MNALGDNNADSPVSATCLHLSPQPGCSHWHLLLLDQPGSSCDYTNTCLALRKHSMCTRLKCHCFTIYVRCSYYVGAFIEE